LFFVQRQRYRGDFVASNSAVKFSSKTRASDRVFDVSDKDFARCVVQESEKHPVLVSFHASWCGPCKVLAPKLQSLVKQAGGEVKLAKVDVDQSPKTVAQLRIGAVPTVHVYHKGSVVDSFQGALPDQQLEYFIAKVNALKGTTTATNPK